MDYAAAFALVAVVTDARATRVGRLQGLAAENYRALGLPRRFCPIRMTERKSFTMASIQLASLQRCVC